VATALISKGQRRHGLVAICAAVYEITTELLLIKALLVSNMLIE
jgi:hypothetical protein